jgi:hypothetical protein
MGFIYLNMADAKKWNKTSANWIHISEGGLEDR